MNLFETFELFIIYYGRSFYSRRWLIFINQNHSYHHNKSSQYNTIVSVNTVYHTELIDCAELSSLYVSLMDHRQISILLIRKHLTNWTEKDVKLIARCHSKINIYISHHECWTEKQRSRVFLLQIGNILNWAQIVYTVNSYNPIVFAGSDTGCEGLSPFELNGPQQFLKHSIHSLGFLGEHSTSSITLVDSISHIFIYSASNHVLDHFSNENKSYIH